MSYARGTEVPIEKSKMEIERLVMRAGASQFASGMDSDCASVIFRLKERVIRFTITLPDRKQFARTPQRLHSRSSDQIQKAWEQGCRERWRALLLCIKAKLESVSTGIEVFEEAFLSQIVTDDGSTVWERAQEDLPRLMSPKGSLLALPAPKEK